MIVAELTEEQRAAVEAPYDESLAILGSIGSGKSTALAQRLARIRARHPEADPLRFDSDHGVDEFAVTTLRSRGMAVTVVDDVEAELLFERACSSLFALEWDEFAAAQLDPEVPGLRSPRRFLASAFRLIRRLRDADVGPDVFLGRGLAGATEFYAKPPNFADPALLLATKNSYHDSLAASPQELMRQHRREIDLAKILAKLYARYVELTRSCGRMAKRDAVVAAADLLCNDAGLAASLRTRHKFAVIDDAQELSNAELRLLRAIFGDRLDGVTVCGDPSSAIAEVRMSNPSGAFALASAKVELHGNRRTARRSLERPSTLGDEAALIAQRVGEWIAQGSSPERIAVVFRSVRSVEAYEVALLDHDIPALVSGDVNVFTDRRALDALALLWNVADPFRHEWLLRTLAGSRFGLSDASLAMLCSEPPDPQRSLFAFDEEPAPTARVSRWNPKRDLRLGWNVIRGERDDALSEGAATRVRHFRELRNKWLSVMSEMPFERFARTVWHDALARDGAPGSARARAQQLALTRLLQRLSAFVSHNPNAALGDVLEYAQQRMDSDLETCEWTDQPGFVQLLTVEAARGREFDRVVVANVRPGAFPRWYSPEPFLFSMRYGVIPKDNAGGARASRTAKFSYYMFRSKAREHYYERERRALAYAMGRARESVLVTASGTPIRTNSAPELLEELR
ncbi:MAG: ATP-dependent helicase [Candidatus Eremiobacteraeota bacterium]|nr:ATP-dependent helicase [Candidatus Eremiobacteraeota bacterium]